MRRSESLTNLGYSGPVRDRAIAPSLDFHIDKPSSVGSLGKRRITELHPGRTSHSYVDERVYEEAAEVPFNSVNGGVIYSFDSRKKPSTPNFGNYLQYLDIPESHAYNREDNRMKNLNKRFQTGQLNIKVYQREKANSIARKKTIAAVRQEVLTRKEIGERLGDLKKQKKHGKIDEISYETLQEELRRKMAHVLLQEGLISLPQTFSA